MVGVGRAPIGSDPRTVKPLEWRLRQASHRPGPSRCFVKPRFCAASCRRVGRQAGLELRLLGSESVREDGTGEGRWADLLRGQARAGTGGVTGSGPDPNRGVPGGGTRYIFRSQITCNRPGRDLIVGVETQWPGMSWSLRPVQVPQVPSLW
jgi:hypothetical protein